MWKSPNSCSHILFGLTVFITIIYTLIILAGGLVCEEKIHNKYILKYGNYVYNKTYVLKRLRAQTTGKPTSTK